MSAVCLSDPVLSARAQKISRRAYWSHAGLNKGEASNSVRRAVFFHHQGEIRDRPDQQARHPDNQIIG
ncbi:MAG: Tn3 family transposase [Stellaceae bacterium]